MRHIALTSTIELHECVHNFTVLAPFQFAASLVNLLQSLEVRICKDGVSLINKQLGFICVAKEQLGHRYCKCREPFFLITSKVFARFALTRFLPHLSSNCESRLLTTTQQYL